MNNISWGTFGTKKEKVVVEERYIIPKEEYLSSKEALLSECDKLIANSEELYKKAPSKELYDSIVTLSSAKRAISSIHISQN